MKKYLTVIVFLFFSWNNFALAGDLDGELKEYNEEQFEENFSTIFPKESHLKIIFSDFPNELKKIKETLEKIFEQDSRENLLKTAILLKKKLEAKYFGHYIRHASDKAIFGFISAKSEILEILGANHMDECFAWIKERANYQSFPETVRLLDEKYRTTFENIFYSSFKNRDKNFQTIPKKEAQFLTLEIFQDIYDEFGETTFNIHITNVPSTDNSTLSEEIEICIDTGMFFWILKNMPQEEAIVFLRSYLGKNLHGKEMDSK